MRITPVGIYQSSLGSLPSALDGITLIGIPISDNYEEFCTYLEDEVGEFLGRQGLEAETPRATTILSSEVFKRQIREAFWEWVDECVLAGVDYETRSPPKMWFELQTDRS